VIHDDNSVELCIGTEYDEDEMWEQLGTDPRRIMYRAEFMSAIFQRSHCLTPWRTQLSEAAIS